MALYYKEYFLFTNLAHTVGVNALNLDPPQTKQFRRDSVLTSSLYSRRRDDKDLKVSFVVYTFSQFSGSVQVQFFLGSDTTKRMGRYKWHDIETSHLHALSVCSRLDPDNPWSRYYKD